MEGLIAAKFLGFQINALLIIHDLSNPHPDRRPNFRYFQITHYVAEFAAMQK